VVFPERREESRRLAARLVVASNPDSAACQTVLRDLSALPPHLLQLLVNDKLDVVILREGQSLADTPLLPQISPETYHGLAARGREIFAQEAARAAAETERALAEARSQGKDDEFHLAMIRYWESRNLEESLGRRLIEENLGFTPMRVNEPVELARLAASRQVPEEDYPKWEETFRLLNEGMVRVEEGVATARQGVVLLPYTYYRGRPVSETSLESYRKMDSRRVKDALGIHLWQDRLVVLHENYVTDPAEEVGHYRIVLHEIGHAIDHALERSPELGPGHAQAISAFFARDKQDLESGGPNRFLSPRAMDNRREYFAEAVEAYLTVKLNDRHDYYKVANNNQDFRRLHPELYSYVDRLMRTELPADLVPRSPSAADPPQA
jgi:hypothetical protein